jgi:hypothetical protein
MAICPFWVAGALFKAGAATEEVAMKPDHRGKRLRSVALIVLWEAVFATLALLPLPFIPLWMHVFMVAVTVAATIVGCYLVLYEVEYDGSGRARLPEDFNIAWWERKP